MVLSMTGFGEATCGNESAKVGVTVRSVNNRHLKITVRCGESHSILEGDVEKLVRQAIQRGTVNVTVRVVALGGLPDCGVNEAVLEAYWYRMRNIQRRLRVRDSVRLGDLLALPGVVSDEPSDPDAARRDWGLVQTAAQQAIDAMNRMRSDEGQAMAGELADFARCLDQHLDEIERRAPGVVDDYRTRLHERLQVLLADADIELDRGDILREISIFTDRSDIREEIVRLRSHGEQFLQTLEADGPAGRKLEFLTQEMFREANTIGSKANDVAISHRIVEIKSLVDRMREQIQNVE